MAGITLKLRTERRMRLVTIGCVISTNSHRPPDIAAAGQMLAPSQNSIAFAA
jgi:hypothetical protein